MLKLNDILNLFPDAKNTGTDIISELMPSYCKVFHIDSHDTQDGFRFQGVVINANPNLDNPHVLDIMPLEVLRCASNYAIIKNTDFLVWTLWFKELP
jgi:hypothetical protein